MGDILKMWQNKYNFISDPCKFSGPDKIWKFIYNMTFRIRQKRVFVYLSLVKSSIYTQQVCIQIYTFQMSAWIGFHGHQYYLG